MFCRGMYSPGIQTLLSTSRKITDALHSSTSSPYLGRASGLEVSDKILAVLWLLQTGEHHLGTFDVLQKQQKMAAKVSIWDRKSST